MQLGEATAANSALQAELDRANVNVDTLTARMAELSSQLANSSEMGGSLRVQNSELMSELALLRWVQGVAEVSRQTAYSSACRLKPCILQSAGSPCQRLDIYAHVPRGVLCA